MTISPSIQSLLQNPVRVEGLLSAVGEADRYELLFHSTFAAKLFKVMQRPESKKEGFERMQQSFREAVEKVREIVLKAGASGLYEATTLTEISPRGFGNLIALINDLAVVKQSEIGQE